MEIRQYSKADETLLFDLLSDELIQSQNCHSIGERMFVTCNFAKVSSIYLSIGYLVEYIMKLQIKLDIKKETTTSAA